MGANAGHRIFGPRLARSDPSYGKLGGLGGTPAGTNAARADARPKIIEFLRLSTAADAVAGRGTIS